MNLDRKSYSRQVLEMTRKFSGTNHSSLLAKLQDAYISENYSKFNEILSQFPSDVQLLEKLTEKLKGKSVYTNLKKVLKGEKINIEEAIIAISSLITHLSIDINKGNREYCGLREETVNKLTSLVKAAKK